MWIRCFPRLYERLKWTRVRISLEMEIVGIVPDTRP